MSNIVTLPTPLAGWNTVTEAEKTARAVGMSLVPLRFKSKLPIPKSHPALSFMQLTLEEFYNLTRTGLKFELGILGGYSGFFAADVDIDDGQGRALVERFLGRPLGVILGNPAHVGKLLYRGPWAEPAPKLVKAARSYFTYGLVFTRAERALAYAKQHFAADATEVVKAEQARAAAEAKHTEARAIFGRLRDPWIEQHKALRSATAGRKDANGNVVLRVEIKSFSSIITMPASRHPNLDVNFRWEEPPALHPGLLECIPRVTREQVEALLQEVDGKGRSGRKTRAVNGDGRPQQPHDGPPAHDTKPSEHEPVDVARLCAALKHVKADDRSTWLMCGAAIKHAMGQLGYPIWDAWSRTSDKYEELDQRKTWDSLKRTAADGEIATVASIFHLAQQGGWKGKADAADEPADVIDGAGVAAGKKKQSAADRLVEIARTADLYHAPDGVGFADVLLGNHRQTWAVASKGFKSWLRHAYYEKTKSAPTSEAMQAAMGVIEARCQFEGREQQTHLRVAAHDGCHYLDLCDDRWRAIEVDAAGWRIVDSRQLPVRFRRTRGMLALPVPEKGGDIEQLHSLLNVPDDRFVLCVSWTLAALRGEGQRPVLVLCGEQGAGKSSIADMLRRFVDPSTAPLRALPRTLWDLYVSAQNGHVLGFDNLSGLPLDISDALCRLSTGGGFSARSLYTDSDEVLFNGQRAVILNGIEDGATRPDLIDRSMLPTLDAIQDHKRRGDAELQAAFTAAAPKLLGALLDAVSCGVRMLPTTKLDKLPRMADFSLWMHACETGCGWRPGTFAKAYAEDQAQAMVKALSADPAVVALRRFMEEVKEWTGTAAGLLENLCRQVSPSTERGKDWPKSPRTLSGRLNRFAPALRHAGVLIERDRTAEERQLHITCAAKFF